MCGIAGVIARDQRRDVSALVERLTQALAHRGPDGSGIRMLRGRYAAFGHRRLSIVDLECGAQPMANEDGRVWVVFNGELYNHLELRRELESRGHEFRTRADTEAVIHGWEEWGPRVLERMNGMYAFALFDGRGTDGGGGEIWLARDPAGVKPLYVGLADGVWWLASELAAARTAGLLQPDLRPEAFGEYLVYRFVPSPGTFYRGAWKVPPGHTCRLALDDTSQAPHFEPFATAFAHAFAIGFPTAPDGGELPLARASAAALDVPLTAVSVADADYLAAWPGHVASLGEPIANSGALLVGLLCRTVKQSRKVVLTGQGADELLGGYPRHAAERVYPWVRTLRPLLAALPQAFAASDRIARMRRVAEQRDEARRFAETLAVFSPREAVALSAHLLDESMLVEPVRRWLPGLEDGADSVNRFLRVDARLSLADDLLIVADHTSMASSVELRVPFLDLELLALLERMPSRYKVSRLGERKWLYRRAIAGVLPPAVRGSLVGWRARTGRKLGFTTPFAQWFRSWLATDADDFFSGPRARLPHFLRGQALRGVVAAARDRREPRERQLLALYVLEAWLRGALS